MISLIDAGSRVDIFSQDDWVVIHPLTSIRQLFAHLDMSTLLLYAFSTICSIFLACRVLANYRKKCSIRPALEYTTTGLIFTIALRLRSTNGIHNLQDNIHCGSFLSLKPNYLWNNSLRAHVTSASLSFSSVFPSTSNIQNDWYVDGNSGSPLL